MKNLFIYFVFALVCMGLSFAHADEQSMNQDQKDQCLLISKDCQNEVLSIQQKMKALQTEIEKGTKVYTLEELKILKNKLKEVEDTLNILLKR